jgi:hypothetical protein
MMPLASQMNVREAAKYLADVGIATVPIPKGSKGPRLKDWTARATTEADVHDHWFCGQDVNIGAATGAKSKIFALDVDLKSGGLTSLKALEAEFGQLPLTAVQRTGGGGLHYLFNWPGEVEIRNAVAIAPGLDIRGEAGVIVVPPSTHASGECYRWIIGQAPWETPPSDAPQWLFNLLLPKKPEFRKMQAKSSRIIVDPDLQPKFKDQPSDAQSIVAGCAVIRSLYQHPSGASEWLWKMALAIIGRSNDGRRLAHHMSSLDDARYSEHDTNRALDRALSDERSVFTCARFAEERPTVCAACSFRHVIKTPLLLGREDPKLVDIQRRHFYATDTEVYFDLERQLVKKAKDFAATYAHLLGGSPHAAFVKSRTSPKVDTLAYMPGATGKTVRSERGVLIGNTYLADGVQQEEGDYSIWQEHFDFIVPNDEGQRDHLLDAIATTIQKPSSKIRHAILLMGGQRTGKSSIARAWARLLGATNAITVGKDELDSTFQGGIYNKQLAVFEELYIRGRDRYNDMKDFISEDEKRAQKKNIDFFTARTPFSVLALSNHDLPLMIPEADDGRWFVIQSVATPRKASYYDQLNEKGGAQLGAFKAALLCRDITNFNANSPPPMTIAKQRIIRDSRPPIEKAVAGILADTVGPLTLPEWIVTQLACRSFHASASQVRDALARLGAKPLGQVRWRESRVSPWAIKDNIKWETASDHEVATILESARPFLSNSTNAGNLPIAIE